MESGKVDENHLYEIIAGVEAKGLEGVQAGRQLLAFESAQGWPHGRCQGFKHSLAGLMLQRAECR